MSSRPLVASDVTVVVPTRNRRDLVLRTLGTVLTQRGVDLEIVVVDEGSTDGTDAALRKIRDDRLVVLRNPDPQGVSAARNRGLAHASGSWVAFLDDDDVWGPDKLRAQLDAAAATPGARWSCGGALHVDEHLRLGRAAHVPPADQVADIGSAMLRGNVIPGGASNIIARTDLVREVGGFDVTLSNMADWDLYVRLGLASPLAVVDRPLLGYVIHATSMAHDVQRSEHELRIVENKYRAERERRGLSLRREPFLWYFAAWYLRQGQRQPAVRNLVEIFRHGSERRGLALGTALVGGLWPGAQLVRERLDGYRVPPDWREEAEPWLAPLRSPRGLVDSPATAVGVG